MCDECAVHMLHFIVLFTCCISLYCVVWLGAWHCAQRVCVSMCVYVSFSRDDMQFTRTCDSQHTRVRTMLISSLMWWVRACVCGAFAHWRGDLGLRKNYK